MENNIKKAIEQIDVPLDKLDAAIMIGVQANVKKRPKRMMKLVLGLVSTLVLVLLSGYISPSMARVLATVPIIGNLYYDIEQQDIGLQVALSDANKIVLNESVTSSDITVTFEEIVFDGERMHVIFSMDEFRDIYPLYIYVDGNLVNQAEGLRELESDTGYRGLWELDFEEELPDAFEINIQIRYIEGIKGDWQITTPIQKVANNEKTIATNQQGQVDGIDYEVIELKTSNTSTVLKMRFAADFTTMLMGEQRLKATITDQQGMPLKVLDFNTGGESDAPEFKYIIEPLANDVSKMVVQLYYEPLIYERKEIHKRLSKTLPQRISFGEMGELVITDIVEKDHLHTLTFKVESSFAFDYDFNPSVHVQNRAGESFVTEYVHAVGPNEYELTYQDTGGDVYVSLLEMPKLEVLERFELDVK